MATNFDALDDLKLIEEVKKVKPDYKFPKSTRQKMMSELVKTNYLNSTTGALTLAGREHAMRTVTDRDALREILREEMTHVMPRQLATSGSMSAIINWNLLLVHGKNTSTMHRLCSV